MAESQNLGTNEVTKYVIGIMASVLNRWIVAMCAAAAPIDIGFNKPVHRRRPPHLHLCRNRGRNDDRERPPTATAPCEATPSSYSSSSQWPGNRGQHPWHSSPSPSRLPRSPTETERLKRRTTSSCSTLKTLTRPRRSTRSSSSSGIRPRAGTARPSNRVSEV